MAEAKTCTDPRCPAHGSLKRRGAVLEGRVVSAKARKTAVVEIPFVRRVRKYERLEKRRSKIHAHIPECIAVREGDLVRIEECRRLSRTKAFVVVKKIEGTKLRALPPAWQ